VLQAVLQWEWGEWQVATEAQEDHLVMELGRGYIVVLEVPG
jgi:hypothetical protein